MRSLPTCSAMRACLCWDDRARERRLDRFRKALQPVEVHLIRNSMEQISWKDRKTAMPA
jgi:hypothetical protein